MGNEKPMLRRILLVVMATVVSYGLTAGGGYVMYTMSSTQSQMHLSLIVRYIVNPLIVFIVGGLVGFLSEDHPSLTAIVGLVPWAAMFYGSMRIGPVLGYMVLGAVVSAAAWRVRNRHEAGKAAYTTRGMTSR